MGMTGKNFHLVAAILCLTVAQVGITFYLPAVPTYASETGVNSEDISKAVAVYLLLYGLTQLIAGPISDKIGRAVVLVIGLTVFSISAFLLLTVSSYQGFMIVRAIQGVGGGMLSVLVKLIIRDAYSGRDLTAAFSILEASSSITPALAPFLGGLIISQWGWRGNFLAVALWSLCAGLISLWSYKQFSILRSKSDVTIIGSFKTYISIVKNRYFQVGGSILLLVYSTILVFLSYSPLLFQRDLLLSAKQYGALMILPAASTAISGYFGTQLSRRLAPISQVRIGILMLLAAGLLLIILSRFIGRSGLVVMVPFMIVAFAAALIFPCIYSLSFQLISDGAGYVAAILGCLQLSGASLIRILVKSRLDSIKAVGLYYIAASLISLLITFSYNRSAIASDTKTG